MLAPDPSRNPRGSSDALNEALDKVFDGMRDYVHHLTGSIMGLVTSRPARDADPENKYKGISMRSAQSKETKAVNSSRLSIP
jgi:hypothetical protein